MSDQIKNDEIVRQILDDKSLSSLSNLKHLNKVKHGKLQEMIIQYYRDNNKRITYNEYLDIVNKLEELTATKKITFKRKNDMFDLSDIE